VSAKKLVFYVLVVNVADFLVYMFKLYNVRWPLARTVGDLLLNCGSLGLHLSRGVKTLYWDISSRLNLKLEENQGYFTRHSSRHSSSSMWRGSLDRIIANLKDIESWQHHLLVC
jgi:hypothetical protein